MTKLGAGNTSPRHRRPPLDSLVLLLGLLVLPVLFAFAWMGCSLIRQSSTAHYGFREWAGEETPTELPF